MNLLWAQTSRNAKFACLFCIILIIILLRSIIVFKRSAPFSFPFNFLVKKIHTLSSQNNCSNDVFVVSIPNILINLTFSTNQIYHHNGIAYDYYSKNDLNQSKAGNQWNIWPLPNGTNHTHSIHGIQISPSVMSKLPFVDQIYIMTDPRFIERHQNLKKAFLHQGISIETVQWRMKWNRTTCTSKLNHDYVYKRLNLKDKPLGHFSKVNQNERIYFIYIYLDNEEQRKCALAMKHADVWYEMAEKNVSLGLILEDDALFVPFFKEKFTRMINAAIEKRILLLNGTCVKPKDKPISNNEWINQNPMIVIGTCFNFHGQGFQSHLINAPPMFSTHKSNPSRCTHAYLLTSCSAQALVDQIHVQKNKFEPSDFMQNIYFPPSLTLQSFWMDPPLAYQGNQVTDLDKIETFNRQTY